MKHYYHCIGLTFITALSTIGRTQAQDTYVPLLSEEAHIYQKIEALNQSLSTKDLGSYLPINRKSLASYFDQSKKNALQGPAVTYSSVLQRQIDRAIGINGEWIQDASGMDGATPSKKPILKYFYTTKENLFHYDQDDFFLAINPVLYTQVGLGLNDNAHNTYTNFRGAELRGRIANRIGFYTMLGDNQEKPFNNIDVWEQQYKSFPGHDYYRRLENGTLDAFVGRGYVSIDLIRNYTSLTFGYDKQFIGNGIRSLIQSNESAASTFLRIKTNVGSFQIDNLYQELVSDFAGLGNDDRLPRKYSSFHQISKNFGKKLNIGLFEQTMYGASNRYSVTNLLPALLIHKALGAEEKDMKTSFGLQFKYLPYQGIQVYGQTMVDYLAINKHKNVSLPSLIYAAQLGIKYFDAFTIKNLDIQVELNNVSEGMYQSANTTRNHTHYNQPLAHSMGNNFTELLGKLKYTPHHKWYVELTGAYFNGPAATNTFNGNIFAPYPSNTSDLAQLRQKKFYGNANIAFELFTNFFIEAGGTYLKGANSNNAYAYGGLRWNISRKQYLYYN